ncbi:hypothetical protein [Sphingomonas sp. Leaf28]|uniref:hypothetical protein n=1 Tax=Sphingomonas sp. Leaf28 TaxID=1735695 RepID=UPI0012E10853|nr:hypothetical protein [Sphingomonas sp. Leaf28]
MFGYHSSVRTKFANFVLLAVIRLRHVDGTVNNNGFVRQTYDCAVIASFRTFMIAGYVGVVNRLIPGFYVDRSNGGFGVLFDVRREYAA